MRGLLPLLFLASTAADHSPASSGAVTWRWDREGIGCDLLQDGSAGTPIGLGRPPGTDEVGLSVKVRSPSIWKGVYEDGVVTLSSGATFRGRIQVYSAENRSYRLRVTVTDPAFLDALSGSSTVSIGHPRFGPFTAQLKDSAAAVAALRQCEESRLRLWGVDPAPLAALKSRPVPTSSLAELFTSFDYPGVGMSGMFGADIIAKLDVAEDGSVRDCHWLGPQKFPQFGQAICKGLKERAHFLPARDATGQAVAAPYVTVAAFRMSGY